MPTQVRADVYTRVTEAILAAIEAGTGNWRMPWHHSGADVTRPTNIASGKPYRGINTVSLWAAAYGGGYASGVWGTYRQWRVHGVEDPTDVVRAAMPWHHRPRVPKLACDGR